MLREELGLDPGSELMALEEAILRQDPALERAESSTTSLVCPYRGLLPYGSEDADTFFGREADVDVCLARLRANGVLAVVGPSAPASRRSSGPAWSPLSRPTADGSW